MSVWSCTLDSFCEQVASPAPVPSCGATACVTAGLALALLQMAIRKSCDQELGNNALGIAAEVEQLLGVMKAHADNDMRTFGAFIENGATGSSRHSRQHALDITLGSLAAARSCYEGIALAQSAIAKVKKALHCDVVSSALMMYASLSALLINVDTDAANLTPSTHTEELTRTRAELQSQADELLARLRRISPAAIVSDAVELGPLGA
ncbi:methenyltetrahydrofolate cyclohydrolase [Pseudomonas fluorescens]|uniref:Methenyltetrahydrofolate cyclohydrolase n=1 Tax=Pseudomonas fluorescens TaxID=294 RepID=A0A3S4NVI5_PSEFL|nr:cyclodeaminase/cyclohydrolase family protein [Pseudomonas fluorescens]VEF10821.1 methenyltetrahydrofolate cyclohydrolase [Pseudomonas fluorescens]